MRYFIKSRGLIPGGIGRKKKPSDFDPKALAAGIKVELEHTSDRKVAREIAMDHLTEDPKYYEKLAQMEAKKSRRCFGLGLPHEKKTSLQKAGPFIGPKGGKWANAAHTIPWKGDLGLTTVELREKGRRLNKERILPRVNHLLEAYGGKPITELTTRNVLEAHKEHLGFLGQENPLTIALQKVVRHLAATEKLASKEDVLFRGGLTIKVWNKSLKATLKGISGVRDRVKNEEAKKSSGSKAIRSAVVRLLRRNPKPDDSEIHALAGRLGIEPDDLEEQIYEMLSSRLKANG